MSNNIDRINFKKHQKYNNKLSLKHSFFNKVHFDNANSNSSKMISLNYYKNLHAFSIRNVTKNFINR